jgi:hypothetical protein
MTEFETATLMVLVFIQGMVIGYITWAPLTPFKQGLMDGLTFKFLRKKNET